MRSFWNGALALPFVALMLICSICSPSARAEPVTWFLQGLTFNDGGTASGSFVYDASTNTFSAINLVTTAGTTRAGSSYGASTGVGQATVADFLDPALPVIDLVSERFLLYLLAPMTNAGGTIGIEEAQELTCLTFECSFPPENDPRLALRTLAGGPTVFITSTRPGVPVSEPTAAALVGVGLVAALAIRRRRPGMNKRPG
jgi:MYXO-CTERM domain-containing protein